MRSALVLDATAAATSRPGDLHNHTTDSDGKGSPGSAFSAGGGLDFLAVTDHTHYLTEGVYSGCKKLADGVKRLRRSGGAVPRRFEHALPP